MVISALMKLAGGSPSLAKELNVDAFLRQVGFYPRVLQTCASVPCFKTALPPARLRTFGLQFAASASVPLFHLHCKRPRTPKGRYMF